MYVNCRYIFIGYVKCSFYLTFENTQVRLTNFKYYLDNGITLEVMVSFY